MGWTLEERRDRVVGAGLELAADHGLEHVTLRAAAAAAGVSWDVAQSSFDDQADLLDAMSRKVSDLTIRADDLVIPAGVPLAEALETMGLNLWTSLSADRDQQLLGYELSLMALRRTALRSMAVRRFTDAQSTAVAVLAGVAQRYGVTWACSVEDLGRTVAAFLDGVVLAWVVDGDDESARRQVLTFARYLATRADDSTADGDRTADGSTAAPTDGAVPAVLP